jgi:hypothetical protein
LALRIFVPTFCIFSDESISRSLGFACIDTHQFLCSALPEAAEDSAVAVKTYPVEIAGLVASANGKVNEEQNRTGRGWMVESGPATNQGRLISLNTRTTAVNTVNL